ncbi:MAG: AAA family ATPase, partial [Clostridia bacterium]|nr:AAA family ATPase [Clostridia bacterium]
MKIKSISCTQFAGIRDKSISLCDGINVIYGKNESGKSTLAELISRTLFQNIKIDKRSDKEFSDLYFPAVKKGSNIVSDFADGKISFTTESGDYTLTKEWGADPRCMLSTPDGVIRDADTAEQILRELLVYTEGVYTNLLLTSQKNTDASLKTLLDAAQGNADKRELSDAVTVAFAESDGISVDTIGSAIDRRINEIAGAHWDSERNMPQRKAGRWASGLGSILKAYYELEDAKAVIQETERLEAEADRSAAQYSEKSQEALL